MFVYSQIIVSLLIQCSKTNPLKYTALCSYTSDCRNSWIVNILFTKQLTAHYKVCVYIVNAHVVMYVHLYHSTCTLVFTGCYIEMNLY